MRLYLLILYLVSIVFAIGVGGGIEDLVEPEPRIGGQVVKGEISCQEDEVIGFVARNTIACIHIDSIQISEVE